MKHKYNIFIHVLLNLIPIIYFNGSFAIAIMNNSHEKSPLTWSSIIFHFLFQMIKQYIKLNKSSLNTKLCKEIINYIKINAWNFRAGLTTMNKLNWVFYSLYMTCIVFLLQVYQALKMYTSSFIVLMYIILYSLNIFHCSKGIKISSVWEHEGTPNFQFSAVTRHNGIVYLF
jgi:hypothetical protein